MDIPFMDSVCSHLLSSDSEPGPVLCAGGQETKVTQIWTLVQPVRLEDEPPSPKNSGRTVTRTVKKGQKARGILNTGLGSGFLGSAMPWRVAGLGMCKWWGKSLGVRSRVGKDPEIEMRGMGLENREVESNVRKGK